MQSCQRNTTSSRQRQPEVWGGNNLIGHLKHFRNIIIDHVYLYYSTYIYNFIYTYAEATFTKCFTVVLSNDKFHVSLSENKILFSLIYYYKNRAAFNIYLVWHFIVSQRQYLYFRLLKILSFILESF